MESNLNSDRFATQVADPFSAYGSILTSKPGGPTLGADISPAGSDYVEGILPGHFGKYQIIEKIGGGGMGVVYKALDTDLDRLVAIKTIRDRFFADPVDVNRFLREAKAVAKLHDPNIISIYDFGLQDGLPYFVMELMPGQTLHHLRDYFYQAPAEEAVAMVEKVARALQVAHDQQIVHRDIKPGNILLDAQGNPKITDFGLAKFLESNDDLTQTGRLLGTPAYMSPEQNAGIHEPISPATDVWALGVVLYELLTRSRPFFGKSNPELKSQIATAAPAAPSKLRGNLSKTLEPIIFKCLEKNPAKRYPRAQALADDLALWRQGMPPSARPPSAWKTVGGMVHRRWLSLTLLASFLLAGAIVLPWAISPTSPELTWNQQVQAQLDKGQKVFLVNEQGKPGGFKWVLGEGASRENVNQDGIFWLNSGKLGLLELFRIEDDATYRFQADLLHELAGSAASEVGLYAGEQLFPHAQGLGRAFANFCFYDLKDLPGAKPNKEAKAFTHLRYTFLPDVNRGEQISFHNETAPFQPK